MRFMVPRRACAAAMPSGLGKRCSICSGRGLKVPLVPKAPFPPKVPFLSGTSFCRKPLPWKAFSPKRDAPPSSTRRRLRALLRAAQGEEPHMRTSFRCLLLAMRLLRSLARPFAHHAHPVRPSFLAMPPPLSLCALHVSPPSPCASPSLRALLISRSARWRVPSDFRRAGLPCILPLRTSPHPFIDIRSMKGHTELRGMIGWRKELRGAHGEGTGGAEAGDTRCGHAAVRGARLRRSVDARHLARRGHHGGAVLPLFRFQAKAVRRRVGRLCA